MAMLEILMINFPVSGPCLTKPSAIRGLAVMFMLKKGVIFCKSVILAELDSAALRTGTSTAMLSDSKSTQSLSTRVGSAMP